MNARGKRGWGREGRGRGMKKEWGKKGEKCGEGESQGGRGWKEEGDLERKKGRERRLRRRGRLWKERWL